MGNQHPFLERPNSTKSSYDAEFLVAATPGAFAPGCAGRVPPQQYLIRLGGATMQGWRKYQEDRIAIMQLIPGRPPLCNSPHKSSTPSPESISMLFLSVFDGHGGSETSDYAALHFHSFLRQKVEERMRHWKEQSLASPIASSSASGSRVKRRHSASESIGRTMTHMSNSSHTSSLSITSTPSALPPHPIDSDFLSRVFLEFDASIPLPAPEQIPRNSSNGTGLRRQQQTPIGNNIPHLASGTTATVCVIDLMNNHVVIAHIGDSRAVVFSGMKDLTTSAPPNTENQKRAKRMSPVSEEHDSSSASSSQSSTNSNSPGEAAASSTKLKMKKRKSRENQQQTAANGSGSGSSGGPTAKQTRRMLRSSGAATTTELDQPSTNFLIQYHSRDHHPDDPIEQQRIQSGQFSTTFLNHQPPTRSRICHSLQRISLNVVRGFGDAWFKLEESAEQQEQMVCAVPDCYFAKFPMALPGAPAVQEGDVLLSATAPMTPTHHRRGTSVTRAESPTNSRSTTPNTDVLAAPNTRIALPPVGETLYVILASDGIWNSEFPPGTDGVSIKHGSATLTKTNPNTPISAPGGPPAGLNNTPATPAAPLRTGSSSAAGDDNSSASSAPVRSSSSSVPVRSSSSTSHIPISSPPGLADEVLPTLTQDDGSEPMDEGEEKANAPTTAEMDDDDDDESSGWSASSSEDEDWPDMQVNMAVSQYFYNHAQPIINRRVQEINKSRSRSSSREMKEPTASAAAAASSSAAAAAMHPIHSASMLPSSSTSLSRSNTVSSTAATVRSDSKSRPSKKHHAPANPFPPVENGYSSIVASALDLLSAPVPLTKQNLKSTDNMSAWLISITPIGVGTACCLPPVVSTGDDFFVSPPPRLTTHTSSLGTLSSPSRQSTFAVPAFRSVAGQIPSLRSPSSATSDSSTPATPRFTSFVTPPLVHQHSEPTVTDHIIPSIRAASMPHASATTIAQQTAAGGSGGLTKAASAAVKPEWPTIASLSTVPPFPKTPSSTVASSSTTPASTGGRKRRRASRQPASDDDEVDVDPDNSPKVALEAAFQSPDPSASASPPVTLPSRTESIADLMFSDNSMTDVPGVPAAAASAKKAKRQTKDRSHLDLPAAKDTDTVMTDEPRSTRSKSRSPSSSAPSSSPSSPSNDSTATPTTRGRPRKKTKLEPNNSSASSSSASVASASSEEDAAASRRASLRSRTPSPLPHLPAKPSKTRSSLPASTSEKPMPKSPRRHSTRHDASSSQPVTSTPSTSLKSGQLPTSSDSNPSSTTTISPNSNKKRSAKKSQH